DELIKIGAFKSGDLANFDEIGQGVERVKKRLRHQGYMRVDIQPERHVLDERKLVDLTLHINQGPQFVMGNLKIEGLDIYAEPQIRKAWALGYGKPFDADLPEAFLARLRDEGVFENLKKTRSKIDVNEQNHSVDVTLYFE
ncbi:MAG TPA: POTRA domain-containing protein, partial [Bryobacteraceae bacterium]|nr:POTRA domain-containing protein [Bryobacteraceae bacterium]